METLKTLRPERTDIAKSLSDININLLINQMELFEECFTEINLMWFW